MPCIISKINSLERLSPRLLVSLSRANGWEAVTVARSWWKRRDLLSPLLRYVSLFYFSPYVFSAITVYVPKAFVTIALRLFDNGSRPSQPCFPLIDTYRTRSFLLFSNLCKKESDPIFSRSLHRRGKVGGTTNLLQENAASWNLE